LNTLEIIFKKTTIDYDVFFHLLRHFKKIDSQFEDKFIRQTKYTRDDIQFQMGKPGSKFRYSFAKNPEELIKNLAIQVDYKSFYISEKERNTEIAIEFDHEVFSDGIGFDGITAIRNLNSEEIELIEKVEREGFILKELKSSKKSTWKLNLILHKAEDNYFIANFFPGIYAPAYPNKEVQSEDDYQKSFEFWDTHAILY